MEISTDDIKKLVHENKRRREVIFGPYNPVTGEQCYGYDEHSRPVSAADGDGDFKWWEQLPNLELYGRRVKIEIADFFIPMMYVPKECMEDPYLVNVVKCGGIKNFVTRVLKRPWNRELNDVVSFEICKIRYREDPEFAMYFTDKITDKKTGKLIPFTLNYPQRKLLKDFEDMRHEGVPIFECLLKARQWGGSTLTQLYIKWMQDFRHPDGWNSIILAQVKGTSKKIKSMYRLAIENTPGWSIGKVGSNLQMSPFENSTDDFVVSDSNGPVRTSTITIASFENVTNVRGSNFHCAHFSEVAYWKKTPELDPEEVISSITGGIDDIPDNIEVFESTGRGASGFFYELCQSAMDESSNSSYRFLFVPFFWIEKDMKEVKNQYAFADWLLKHKDDSDCPAGFKEPGKFFWRLWELGATFESINWYRVNRNRYMSHASMATEAPVDSIEAFRNSGNLIFNPYSIDALEKDYNEHPAYYAQIDLLGEKGKEMIRRSRLRYLQERGELKIWALPNNNILKIKNRYLVSVDIGGKNPTSDYTVMTVIDRKGQMPDLHGKPEVVARWRGHCRHDILAWKAAVLAHFYDDALLVIESNTADREKNNNTEGDHFGTIIEEIAKYYKNMYLRIESPESTTDKVIMKYGFQTNKLTKGWIIDNLISCLDDKLWIEHDKDMFHEMRIYIRRDDGTLGNIESKGNHDDVVMSTAIGLWVSLREMDAPTWRVIRRQTRVQENITEATF